jgi:replication factor A1
MEFVVGLFSCTSGVSCNHILLTDFTDVIGVVKEVGELSTIVSKMTQKTIPKRELTMVDQTGFSCRLTLWGKQAESYSTTDQPVIAFKGVKVSDFNGR